jgi:hypothetical protein
MSGLTVEMDNETTDYGTTSYGKEHRAQGSVEGAMDYRTTRLLTTGQQGRAKSICEGKPVPECVLR